MKKFLAAAAATLVLGWAGTAGAAPVSFSCPATASKCNGATYAVVLLDDVGPTYRLDVLVNTAGINAGIAYLGAVAIKDYTTGTVSAISLLPPVPVGGPWNSASFELNANGCGGGSGGDRICAESTGTGAPVTPAQVITFSFQFDSTAGVGPTAHLKYQFLNASGDKVGDLGSYEIGIQQCAPSTQPGGGLDCDDSTPVPEPASMLLLGAGLLGLAAKARRRR